MSVQQDVKKLITRLTQATQVDPMADSADVEQAAQQNWTNFNGTLAHAVGSGDVRKWAEGPPAAGGTFRHGKRKLSRSADDAQAEAWASQNDWHRQVPINGSQWRHDDACPTCANKKTTTTGGPNGRMAP